MKLRITDDDGKELAAVELDGSAWIACSTGFFNASRLIAHVTAKGLATKFTVSGYLRGMLTTPCKVAPGVAIAFLPGDFDIELEPEGLTEKTNG